MKGLSHFNETWRTLIAEMCKRVGANPDDIDFKDNPSWFSLYTWTKEQEKDYKDWFVNYLSEDRKRLADMSQTGRADKRRLVKIANAFVFQYGWRTSE